MKQKNETLEELISILESIPASDETIELPTGNLIVSIIDDMAKNNLLDNNDSKSVFEITMRTGTFICMLNNEKKVEQIFRVTKDAGKVEVD